MRFVLPSYCIAQNQPNLINSVLHAFQTFTFRSPTMLSKKNSPRSLINRIKNFFQIRPSVVSDSEKGKAKKVHSKKISPLTSSCIIHRNKKESTPEDDQLPARLRGVVPPLSLYYKGKNFHKDRLVGSGAFGTVYLMTSECGDALAVKTLREKDRSDFVKIQNEYIAWTKLKHENIVCLLKHQEDELHKLHFFLMEYAAHEDLVAFIINTAKTRTPKLRHTIGCQLISAVAFIHDSGFVHGDLKPDNVVFSGPETVKICDFGVARPIRRRNGKEIKSSTYQGTRMYFTPEKWNRKFTFGTKDDVWALGFVILNMAIGAVPWTEPLQVNQHYRSWCEEPENDKQFSKLMQEDPVLYETCRAMLLLDEKVRWSAAEARESPYMSQMYVDLEHSFGQDSRRPSWNEEKGKGQLPEEDNRQFKEVIVVR
ncbi:hypothetical protein QR680_011141 [Steinernema hermaphroditum]|uniref:Protein kinase domain-containing protein n=1 Tax=Steinernema hermaphroditum TaxID=289476 RepID=A0AA39IRB7_9BILA|nr:hypothetical protein QR680_011141 [Steinernema hermaphroditum]